MSDYDPIIIESARGCKLKDIDGNELIDGVSSLWCNVHGHQHPVLDQAIKDQLAKVGHVTNLGMSNDTALQLAHRLIAITPQSLQHVFFSSDGASAVEIALKMAFQYWRQCENPEPSRRKYLTFSAAYHGDTIGTSSVGGIGRFNEVFSPLMFDVVRFPSPNVHHPGIGCEADYAQSELKKLDEFLSQHSGEIAALVIEPLVHGAAGMVMHPEGFLQGVRDLTRKHNVLMIADEIAVGFGRTGKLFACEHEDVEPDLMCIGKGLTAGYLPMAATLASSEIYNAFLGSHAESRTFFHGHTFAANPLAAAVSIANLDVFESENTLESSLPLQKRIVNGLSEIALYPNVSTPRNRGMLAAFDVVPNGSGKTFDWQENRGHKFCKQLLRHGVWLRPLGNAIILMPPFAISMEELDQIFDGIKQVLDSGEWNSI